MAQGSVKHNLQKGYLSHPEILLPLLVIPGLQNKPFPPVGAGFPSPETALHAVTLLQDLVFHYQLLSLFLFFLVHVLVSPKTLLLLEELLLPPCHLLGGAAGEVSTQIHLASSTKTQPK